MVIRFRLHYRNEVIHMRVPMIGRHSVHTALRAAAVGLVEGLSWQDSKTNGSRSENTQLRLIAVRTAKGARNSRMTPIMQRQSFTLAALNSAEEMEGCKIAVLGDMLELGQYEQQGHKLVGVRAAEVADELITIGSCARFIADLSV